MLVKYNIEQGKELITCWRNPTPGEIKFGEGAIHYRDFSPYEIGRNKEGKLKKWFKASDDGLIYHTT
jgi:hypothetical protein